MAQTRKKRRSKHRGNAAGAIEARGRTGRRPNENERKLSDRELAAKKRRERMMREPTWKGAVVRAALAALVLGVALLFLFKTPAGQVLSLMTFAFIFYIPLGYYTDVFIYRRRLKQEQTARDKPVEKKKGK